MPLDELNYENFFLGNAAEYWVASQLYFHGFEAGKYSPDFGIDLVVTNAARSKFKGEELWTRFLQIKSSFLVQGAARIYVDPGELDYLASESGISSVYCFFTPRIEGEPQSFDRGDFEPWRASLEAEMDQNFYDTHFHARKQEIGCLSSFDFKGFDLDYFWMNNRQLNRSIEEGFWSDEWVKGKHLKMLRAEKVEDEILLVNHVGKYPVIRETRNIYYLYKRSKSSDKVEQGAFNFDHY